MSIESSHVIVRVLDINRLISKRTGARITRKAGTPQVTACQRAVTEMGLSATGSLAHAHVYGFTDNGNDLVNDMIYRQANDMIYR